MSLKSDQLELGFSIDNVSSFKNYINRDFAPVPKYYLAGSRKSQILHRRLRTSYSSLNNELFLKSYLTLHYAVVVVLKTLNISSLDALDTTNTEQCFLMRFPSTSPFSLCVTVWKYLTST